MVYKSNDCDRMAFSLTLIGHGNIVPPCGVSVCVAGEEQNVEEEQNMWQKLQR